MSLEPNRRFRKRLIETLGDFLSLREVFTINLSKTTQKAFNCEVGVEITEEKPWNYVEKSIIENDLDTYEEHSELAPLKTELLGCLESRVLFMHNPNELIQEQKEYFYVVTKESVASQIINFIEASHGFKMHLLEKSLYRETQHWNSLGSEDDMEEKLMKNRLLIQVELEAPKSLEHHEEAFTLVPVEDRKYGYWELPSLSAESKISRCKVNSSVQVLAETKEQFCQTDFKYPSNVALQYNYEYSLEGVDLDQPFLNKVNLEEVLNTNYNMNLYQDDFKNLKELKTNFKIDFEKTMVRSIMDVEHCKKKMVNSLSWSPFYTDLIAISYVDKSTKLQYTGKPNNDEANDIIFNLHCVLIWSVSDNLVPRLILEAPRDISFVSFCPYDENVVIGGARNGLIVLWDINGRISQVESVELLNEAQRKNRQHLYGFMNWMQRDDDANVVRATAVSDLRFSHKGSVEKIIWSSQFYEVSSTGKLNKTLLSKQFFTGSEDASILIWDLNQIPVNKNTAALRRLKRLKQRPAGLTLYDSPYRNLHLIWKPIYRINLEDPETKKELILTDMDMDFARITYEKKNMVYPKVSMLIVQRFKQEPLSQEPTEPILPCIRVGTITGEYYCISWRGLDFDTKEEINFENCSIERSYKLYHDGPIVAVNYNPNNKLTLTVGGKIFALWHDDLPDIPLLFRKSKILYNTGRWNKIETNKIQVERADGQTEFWIVSIDSKNCLQMTSTSSHQCTATASSFNVAQTGQPTAFADSHGFTRLYKIYLRLKNSNEEVAQITKNFIKKELKRKQDHKLWKKLFADNVVQPELVPSNHQLSSEELQQKKRKMEEDKEFSRMRNVIITRKQIDTKELKKKSEPLHKLQKEAKEKKQKQQRILGQKHQILRDNITTLFPDLSTKRDVVETSSFSTKFSMELKQEMYNSFVKTSNAAEEAVKRYSYNYEFDWKAHLLKSKSNEEQKSQHRFSKEFRAIVADAGNQLLEMKRINVDFTTLNIEGAL